MEKAFNEASRKLFSAECPVSECHEGKPSSNYVNSKVYESYFNLLDKFAEFRPQLDAINNGHKAWSSKFEIDGKKYTVKALDSLTAHNFNDAASFSTAYLPEGYVRIETDDSADFFQFSEFHKEMKKNPELLSKFDEAFARAQKIEITDEYLSDLRVIFANTLSPMHAVAANDGAFSKMLDVIGIYHPDIDNFLLETYNSRNGLAQLLEHQAECIFEERRAKKLARPETLEDVLETGLLEKFAIAIKRASCTVPGLLVATAAGTVAASHAGDASGPHHDNEKSFGITHNSETAEAKSLASNSWQKLSEKNIIIPGGINAAVYDSKNNKVIGISSAEINVPVDIYTFTYAYNVSSGELENKSSGITPDKDVGDAIYDSESEKVIALAASGFGNDIWAYSLDTNSWEKKVTPGTVYGGKLTYDSAHDKVIMLSEPSTNESIPSSAETMAYDYNSNTLTNLHAKNPPPHNALHGSVPFVTYVLGLEYDAKDSKTLLFAKNNKTIDTWAYDYSSNEWAKKPATVSPDGTKFNYVSPCDSAGSKIITQLCNANSSVFETWSYDYIKNEWANENPSTQITVSKPPLWGLADTVFDSKTNQIVVIYGQDTVYTGGHMGVGCRSCAFWAYSQPALPLSAGPTFIISAGEPDQMGAPQKISSPQAGDDTNVANNHANGMADQQQFTDNGKPVVFYKEVTGLDGSIYKQYWLYYTDNPAYILAPGFKDHHAHDWEAVIDKYALDGTFIGRATSYHINPDGASGRGWKFTSDASKPVYIELAGHAMSSDSKDFLNPLNLAAKDPTNNEDLHPAFYHKDGKVLSPADYAIVDLQTIIDDSQLDAKDSYKTDGYPDAASAFFGDASKVPWKSSVFSSPWQIFDDKGKSEAKSWQNSIESWHNTGEGAGIEARMVAKGSRLVLGEENSVAKADIQGAYVKSGNVVFLASDFSNSYDNAQLEIYGVHDSTYKVTMHVTDNVNGQSIAEERIAEKNITKGDTHIIKLDPADLQPIVTITSGPPPEPGPNNPNNPNTPPNSEPPYGPIGAGIAGVFAALGLVGYFLKRRKQKPKQEPQPFYPQQYPYAQPQQYGSSPYVQTPQYPQSCQNAYRGPWQEPVCRVEQAPQMQAMTPEKQAAKALADLDALRGKGMITNEEFQQSRNNIMQSLQTKTN